MAVNARTFNGTSDKIVMSAGTGAHSHFGTMVVVGLSADDTGFRTLMAAGNITAAIFQHPPNTGLLDFWIDGSNNSQGPTATMLVADGWFIAVMAKATGSVKPRFHCCHLSGLTWVHEDGNNALANWAGDTTWQIGDDFISEFWSGTIYCAAYWDARVLSDAECITINGLQAILNLGPTHFWVLNQTSTATAVTDTMGTGADQATLSGTSVSSVTIPNFAGFGSAPLISDTPPIIHGRGAA